MSLTAPCRRTRRGFRTAPPRLLVAPACAACHAADGLPGRKIPQSLGFNVGNASHRVEIRLAAWALCAGPAADIDGARGHKVAPVVSLHAGRKHLPVIQLKRIA